MTKFIFNTTDRQAHSEKTLIKIREELQDIKRLLKNKNKLSSTEVLVSFINDGVKTIESHITDLAEANGYYIGE